MGLFDKLFGKKAATPATPSDADAEDEDLRSTSHQAIEGPPEFVRAVGLQRAYWTHNAAEQADLEARGIEQLTWRERLRLHHLTCLQRLQPEPVRAAATAKCEAITRRLLAADSPYRPRPAMVWQGNPAQPDAQQEPDLQGVFRNPSITHLGCLEIYRLNPANEPTSIDFVSFDELSGVYFAPSKIIRATKLVYEDGRDEIVFVPLLYSLTWEIGNEFDRDGRMTRFVHFLADKEIGEAGASGMGVGQQDFAIRNQDGGSTLFGLGSVAAIAFPLDMRDPRFDEKARLRGIDPDEVRKRMG
jgi:hypothetical protein